jgi:hypothetical protein
MIRKGNNRMRTLCVAIAACAGISNALAGGHVIARADAKATSCTPDNNPAFGPSLDALDPCRADTGSLSDDNAHYSYSTAIVSHVQVPVPMTTVDALGTGGTPAVEYVWVDYIRPNVAAGVKVPTIMDASPYYNTLGRGYDGILKSPTDPNAPEPVSVLRCGGANPCTNYAAFPEWEAHYFVPRGYAVALMDLRGTRNSSGCEIYGDKQEALDAVAAIDWIAGQSWSNQRVGMIGGSYDGTLANGAAALYPLFGQYHNVDGHGMDALAAVVPIRAIDRWYDYQYFNGVGANGQELDPELFTGELPVEDWPTNGPTTGDPTYAPNLAQRKGCPAYAQVATDAGYTAPYQDVQDAATTNFWNSRDFLQYAPTWKAATMFIHGLFDNNVKTMNSGAGALIPAADALPVVQRRPRGPRHPERRSRERQRPHRRVPDALHLGAEVRARGAPVVPAVPQGRRCRSDHRAESRDPARLRRLGRAAAGALGLIRAVARAVDGSDPPFRRDQRDGRSVDTSKRQRAVGRRGNGRRGAGESIVRHGAIQRRHADLRPVRVQPHHLGDGQRHDDRG